MSCLQPSRCNVSRVSMITITVPENKQPGTNILRRERIHHERQLISRRNLNVEKKASKHHDNVGAPFDQPLEYPGRRVVMHVSSPCPTSLYRCGVTTVHCEIASDRRHGCLVASDSSSNGSQYFFCQDRSLSASGNYSLLPKTKKRHF